MIKTVKKRNGELVEFDPNKLNMWAEWASGIGVDWSSVVLEATRKCYDGCTTDELHSALIAACVDKETTAHLKMAGRLYIGAVYKRSFGDWKDIPTVGAMYDKMTALGLWDTMDYSPVEFAQAQGFIDHSLDLQATLTETKQAVEKYAISDKVSKINYETPQFMYMRMALGNMERMPKHRRMQDVQKLYEKLSRKKINAPTPFSLNLGTAKRQYASCCTFTTNDTLQSLAAGSHIAEVMTGAQAGIGSHLKTRSIGDKVRGGAIVHMGKLPYYRVQESVVGANVQAGRGGANTMHFNVMDPEIEDLLRLKNVQTVSEKRIKDIDYSVGFNPFFAEKVASNEQWMLTSFGDAPGLYALFYSWDIERFAKEYERVLKDPSIKKTMVSARAIAIKMLSEEVGTGRMYEHNAYEMNSHTPFKETIWCSNLCQEIALVTDGFESAADLYQYNGVGEIGLCNLAAIAAGLVADDEYEETAYYAVLMIDNVIEMMDYPFPRLEKTAKARRSIGVGITNLAYAMAKEGLKYTTLEGKQFIHRLAERHSYFLHKASLRLAKERGPCEWIHKTHYPRGWLPIDTANEYIRNKIGQPLLQDWEGLRKEIIQVGGLRNSVLEAHMPCESSSIAGGHTNSLYPIRAYKVIKTSGNSKNLFIAPELDTLKGQYQLAWDVPTMDMTEVYAIVQCFTGQAISADFYLKYEKDKREISVKTLVKEWLYRVKCGLKTKYYTNSATGVELAVTQEEAEPDCESCSL